jgi:cytochrome c551/c552
MTMKKMTLPYGAIALLVILAVGTSGCAGEEAAATGDPQAGQVLYELGPEGVYEPTCVSCHRLSDLGTYGPGFEGIADRAATRVPGLSAEQYLRQSIVDPGAYIVEGDWGGHIMPANYAEAYSEEDINDLIAFLLTQ